MASSDEQLRSILRNWMKRSTSLLFREVGAHLPDGKVVFDEDRFSAVIIETSGQPFSFRIKVCIGEKEEELEFSLSESRWFFANEGGRVLEITLASGNRVRLSEASFIPPE